MRSYGNLRVGYFDEPDELELTCTEDDHAALLNAHMGKALEGRAWFFDLSTSDTGETLRLTLSKIKFIHYTPPIDSPESE